MKNPGSQVAIVRRFKNDELQELWDLGKAGTITVAMFDLEVLRLMYRWLDDPQRKAAADYSRVQAEFQASCAEADRLRSVMLTGTIVERIAAAKVLGERFVPIEPRDQIDMGSRRVEWNAPQPMDWPLHKDSPANSLMPATSRADIVMGRDGHLDLETLAE